MEPSGKARLLTRTNRREHISPGVQALHWLPIEFRICFKIIHFTHKTTNGICSSYRRDALVPCYHKGTLHSKNGGLLIVSRVCKSTGTARAFCYKLLSYGRLTVKRLTVSTFKIRLKMFLLEKVYGQTS